jgi:imidazolonepropionase-like amidohydrolase
MVRRGGRAAFMRPGPGNDPVKAAMEKIETIKTFFTDAKAYYQEKTHATNNLKLEAVRGLFDGKQKLFVRANEVKQILMAMDLAKTFGFKLVIVGGTEAYQVADLLAENNVPVILDRQHSLPTMEDDDVDQPYKTPAVLQKAGVLFCLNDTHDQSRFRNLAFNAGTAATYGLTKEQALSAVTLNAAKILGIEDKTGTIEIGKDANLLIVNGDLLDMKSSVIAQAFIQGRNVSLDNKGCLLFDLYIYQSTFFQQHLFVQFAILIFCLQFQFHPIRSNRHLRFPYNILERIGYLETGYSNHRLVLWHG